jgi:outer membrane protein TolC
MRRQELARISEELLQQSRENAEIGDRMFAAGLIPEVDRLALEITHSSSQASLEAALSELEQERIQFNRLIGLPLDTPVSVAVDTSLRVRDVDADRAVNLAGQNRSERRRAEIDLERIQLDLKRTRSLGRPSLNLNLSYDMGGISSNSVGTGDPWSDHLSAAFDPDNYFPFSNVALTLQFPLFDWGRQSSAVQRQQARVELAERRVEEVELQIERTVRQIADLIGSMSRRAAAYARNRQLAGDRYEISQALFEEGEIGSTELLLALQQRVQSETQFFDALVVLESARAALNELTLWDWESESPIQIRTQPPGSIGR